MGTKIGALLDPRTADRFAVDAMHIRRGIVLHGVIGAAATIDPAAASHHVITLTDEVSELTLGAAKPGTVTELRVIFYRSGTGDRVVTWATPIIWLSGSPPIFGGVPGAPDIVDLLIHDGAASWLGWRVGGGAGADPDPVVPTLILTPLTIA